MADQQDRTGAGAAGQAAKAAKTARAAALLANPWTWVVVAVLAVVFLLVFLVGIAVAGIAGSGGDGDDEVSVEAGEIGLSGKELRDAFLAQRNITYQKEVIKTEIRSGDVKDNVLRAVLAAAKQPRMGNLAISSAACASHKAGSFHCPPGQALDIGSVGTDNPHRLNQFLCDSALKEGNPYKINELFGIANPGCVLDNGRVTGSNPDGNEHVHVATD
ncbi:MAG: hypothetical protein WD603_00325 [Patescibacteria group bacterium]